MARLILEEGGERRAFRVNDGKLSIGSGEKCSLTLASPDIAEVHAELEVKGDEVVLRPKPGVTPPTVLGKAISQPTRLPKSAEFRIGSAVFRLEPEPASAPAAPAVKPVAGSRGGGRSAARPSGGGVKPSESPRVVASRRGVKRGIPTWLILVIIAVIGAATWFVIDKAFSQGAGQFDPNERYRVAVEAYGTGAYERCKLELDRIDPKIATPELMAKVAEMRENIAQKEVEGHIAVQNVQGTEWLETQLKKYVERYLQGDKVDRSRARLFIKRCDEFRRRWPQHPELDWVERYKDRFLSVAEMNDPSDLADVEWEVKRLTAGKPRDYVAVFAILDEFLGRASGADRNAAEALRETQVAERKAFAEDQMLQSRYEWRNGKFAKAMGVLVQLITLIGDEQLKQDALDAYLAMKDHDGRPLTVESLAGYQTHLPDTFQKLMEVPELRELARAEGLLK